MSNSYHKAIDILDAYSVFGPSVQRLVTTLQLLFDTIPRQYLRRKQQPQQLDGSPSRLSVSHDPNLQNTSVDVITTESLSHLSPVDFGGAGAMARGDNPEVDAFLDFDAVFDPQDLSWLTTIPLEL